jgi:hypothetical protein
MTVAVGTMTAARVCGAAAARRERATRVWAYALAAATTAWAKRSALPGDSAR